MQTQEHHDRRRFIKEAGALLGITVCAASMAAILQSCEKDESKIVSPTGVFELSLSRYTELRNVGGAVKLIPGNFNNGRPVIVTRIEASTFLCVSSVCNHAGCEVSAPTMAGENIRCNYEDNKCGHGAEFSPVTGLQVIGPGGGTPTGGLTVIPTTYSTGTSVVYLNFL